MEEIAERAGISRGTLYTYAKNKEAIVDKLVAETGKSRMDALLTEGAQLQDRSVVITSYAIAGFANFGSIARL